MKEIRKNITSTLNYWHSDTFIPCHTLPKLWEKPIGLSVNLSKSTESLANRVNTVQTFHRQTENNYLPWPDFAT